jgi:hypothetical protein
MLRLPAVWQRGPKGTARYWPRHAGRGKGLAVRRMRLLELASSGGEVAFEHRAIPGEGGDAGVDIGFGGRRRAASGRKPAAPTRPSFARHGWFGGEFPPTTRKTLG